jgi:hypothetical protein
MRFPLRGAAFFLTVGVVQQTTPVALHLGQLPGHVANFVASGGPNRNHQRNARFLCHTDNHNDLERRRHQSAAFFLTVGVVQQTTPVALHLGQLPGGGTGSHLSLRILQSASKRQSECYSLTSYSLKAGLTLYTSSRQSNFRTPVALHLGQLPGGGTGSHLSLRILQQSHAGNLLRLVPGTHRMCAKLTLHDAAAVPTERRPPCRKLRRLRRAKPKPPKRLRSLYTSDNFPAGGPVRT